mgnify:FL=1
MACKRCNSLGILMRVVDTLHGKDFYAEQCDCELEAQYEEDRKVLIHDVCEAPPKSGYCSKEGAKSPE